MKGESSQRQRPLFHDGPCWHQLDKQLQQQLVGRLTDICYSIVATLAPAINPQEQSNDDRKD